MSVSPRWCDRFLKVVALAERGATEGERDAARTLAEAMAAKQGLTYDQARGALSDGYRPKRKRTPSIWSSLSPDQRAAWLATILNAVTFRLTEPECRAIVMALDAIKAGDDHSPKETMGIIRRVCQRAYKAGYRPPQGHAVQEFQVEAA